MIIRAHPVDLPSQVLSHFPNRASELIRERLAASFDDGSVRYLAKSGKHPGSLAGWLQPATASLADPQTCLAGLGGAMQTLQSLAALSVGLQVVNIAVSAVGFAIVCHKLNRIEGKLDRLAANLDAVRQEVQELRITAEKGFVEIHKRLDTKLLARATGSIETMRELIRAGRQLDGGAVTLLRSTKNEADAVFVDSMRAYCYARAVEMLKCSANLSVALALAWACEGQWDNASDTIEGASEEQGRNATAVVKALLGGWPSVYMQAPQFPLPSGEFLYDEKLSLAMQTQYPETPPTDLMGRVRMKYPIYGDGRCTEVGDVRIPVPLRSDQGVYVEAPNLKDDEMWARFHEGKVATVDLAAQAAATAMMVERTRLALATKVNPLQLQSSRISEQLEFAEVI